MKRDDFLIELLCEELPPGVQGPAVEALAKGLEGALAAEKLAPVGKALFSTPRRLAVLLRSLPEKGEDSSETRRGPRVEAAFKDGQPTPAALGFAKGAGVPVDRLGRVRTEQGEFLEAKIEKKGKTLAAVLAEALPGILKGLPFPKVMRWGEGIHAFSRPLRGLVLLHGAKVIRFSQLGVESGGKTLGPRVLGSKPLSIPKASSYKQVLAKAGVLADREERRKALGSAFEKAAKAVKGGRLRADDDLLETVTNDVENAFVLSGSFEKKFLELPEEVIVTAMKEHQKYFAVEDGSGNLLPAFVAATGLPHSGPVVVSGHERVLRARLEDARFYMTEDLKTGTAEKAARLDQVIFIREWGSMKDRTDRLVGLVRDLGGNPTAVRIAELCKADLVTLMIKDGKEFTKLQGAIGRIYAEREGITPEVARGIEQHYWPRFPGDALPDSLEAGLVALAEKADHIAIGFITGKAPTGSTDPFGLRRHAIGILTIMRRKPELKISLGLLADEAVKGYVKGFGSKVENPDQVKRSITKFLQERLMQALKDQGISAEALQAVLATNEKDLFLFEQRAKAIDAWRGKADAEKRLTALLRALRILNSEGAKGDLFHPFRQDLAQLPSEKALDSALNRAKGPFQAGIEASDFAGAFAALEPLREPIDAFFTESMVMDKDQGLRRNRLALCARVRDLTIQLGDLTKLGGEAKQT